MLGATEVGINSIWHVEFHSSKLKELRAEARAQAVVAARAKAELYCKAAGVKLGEVIHIEDLNPDVRRASHRVEFNPEFDEVSLGAFNPNVIVVGAAVRIAFKFDNS